MPENYDALFLFGALSCAVLAGIVPLFFQTLPSVIKKIHAILLALSGVSAALAGGCVLSQHKLLTWDFSWSLWNLHLYFSLDSLSSFFLLLIGLITFCIAFYIPSYLRKHEHTTRALIYLSFKTSLFILSMYGVVLSHDILSFMFCWELMSLSSYFLVIYHHHHTENRQAGMIYLIMAHLSGLLILLSFSVIANASDGLSFADLQSNKLLFHSATFAFILALLGFGMKAGLIPLHAWLPLAHPAAPSHISALMSGVMIKIAIYGFIRVVFCFLHPDWQWGALVLALGSVSALLGVLYALMQHNLKKLLAYHSIENIGIIFMGLGLSLIFLSQHQPLYGILGLLAALYHCLNHAIFKSLLFLGAGTISQRTQEHELDQLGGLIHRMPYTALFFLIGCLSISGLPPLNGFVSEWLTFQTALQPLSGLNRTILHAFIPISAAILALTTGLAAVCFVKTFGIIFLGQPRSRHARLANCPKWGMQTAMALLAFGCVFFGILPNLLLKALNAIPEFILGVGLSALHFDSNFTMVPIVESVSSYNPCLIALSMLLILFIIYSLFKIFKRQEKTALSPLRPWDCGFGGLSPAMQYTSTAFAMPIRRVFSNLWEIQESLSLSSVQDPKDLQQNKRYKLVIIDRLWKYLYLPLHRIIFFISKKLGLFQNGSVRLYLAYLFFILLGLLWWVGLLNK